VVDPSSNKELIGMLSDLIDFRKEVFSETKPFYENNFLERKFAAKSTYSRKTRKGFLNPLPLAISSLTAQKLNVQFIKALRPSTFIPTNVKKSIQS
jgi:hypothetical protein